jgi:hypothetical protein
MAKVIKLTHKSSNVKLTKKTPQINITQKIPKIVIKQVGFKGQTGPQGPIGLGLPAGGNEGDIIVKASDNNYDYEFKTPNQLADKTYSQSFTVSSVITVTHNLNKYPAIQVMDSAGDEVVGEIYYSSTNEAIVRFNNPFSGIVTCN